MAYEKQIEDFAESKATWVSSNQLPLLNTVQLVRGWKAVSDTEKATNEDYLNTYISPKNATPSSTIEDPQADGCGDLEGGVLKNVFTGIWRHVSTAWSRENQLYLQTLRLGWASTLADDECMIKTGSDTRDDARSYTFYWRNIASTAVDACVAGLRGAGSLVNPLVQGETKAGTFAIADIVPEQQEDGSYWILAKTIKVATVASASDLDGIEPVRKAVHVVENPFGLEGGYTAHIGRKPTDGIVLTYRALSKDSQAVLEALTDAELQARLSTAEKLKYEFIKKDVTEDSGNTLTLALVYQYIPLATTITAESARYVGVTRKNQSNKIIVEISWPRIDPLHIGTISALALFTRDTVTDPVVEGITYAGEYFVNTTTAPMTDNDGIRIVQKMTKAGDQTLDLVIGKDPDHLIYEFFRWDISKNDIDEFMTETGGELHAPKIYNWGTSEVGILKNVSVVKQEDESFNLHAIYSTTAGLAKTELAPQITIGVDGVTPAGTPLGRQDTKYRSTETAYGWNIPVASLRKYMAWYKPDPAVVNQRNKFNISRQTEHVFDFQGERETFVPIDSGWLVVIDDEFKKVSIRAGVYILKEDLADTKDFGRPASVPPNTKYEQAFKENDLGSFEGQLTKTEYQEIDSGNIVIESTKAKIVTRREGAYLLDATLATNFSRPAYVAGTEVELKVTPNDVMTHSATIITTVHQSQVNTSIESDYSKKVTKTENTAASAALTDPGQVSGFIKSVINEERPDGKIKTISLDEAELDQTAAGGESTLLETVEVDEHTSGTTVTVPTGAQNVKVEVVEAPTRGGKLKTKKVTSTLNEWTGTDAVVADNGITKVKRKLAKNLKTHPTATVHQEIRVGDNDRGGYNAVTDTVELSTSASGTKAVHNSSEVEWGTTGVHVRTPTWSVTTNSDEDANITGWNTWLSAMARSRTITTNITKTYTLTEPTTLTATTAVVGGSEGAGTSYSKEARQVAVGVWETVEKSIVTSAWSAWGNGTLTWMNWVQSVDGSGSNT